MAIYQPTFLTPRNSAIDVSEANAFTCQVNGTTIDKYRLRIFPIAGGSAVYDTGDVVLSPTLGDKSTLSVTVPANAGTLANGNEYKWTIQTFEGANSETSDEVAFVANANPVVALTVSSPITTQSFTFTPTYSQAQNVPVQYSYFIFRDASGNQILRTPDNFSGNLSYTFDGFLSNTAYSVQFFGFTQNGVAFQTAIINFTVQYAQPNINIKPTITQDRNTSVVNVAWGNVVVIPGTEESLNNSITNPDFSSGTTGWTGIRATLSASNNILSVTGDGSGSSTIARQTVGTRNGTTWFGYYKGTVTNSDADSLTFDLGGSGVGTITNPVLNQQYEVYGKRTVANDGASLFAQPSTVYPDSGTANGKTTNIDGTNGGVFAIDMTTQNIADKTADQMAFDAQSGGFELDYISNYLVQDNTAVDLKIGNKVSWTVGVPETFTAQRVWQKKDNFTDGVVMRLTGTSKNYEVGYNGTRWYYNNGGAQGFSELISLSTNPLIIYMRPTDVYIWDETANTLTRIATN